MQTISATELARHTRDILDRVAKQGETFAIARHHTQVAQLVPAPKAVTASQALSGLDLPELTPLQASDWLEERNEGLGDKAPDDFLPAAKGLLRPRAS